MGGYRQFRDGTWWDWFLVGRGFSHDTRLVWVIHPDEKYVLVYHAPEPDRFLRPSEMLDGEAIVPGFAIAVAELFEEWDF
ncbi:MAG: hypothetical protein B0A82_11015 [Alkalinema sp. CACIAM 70d]|nr:MAG: hypothetical protein B0A82_11015 [Alkalinema sp. CACIAM 70d]